MKVCLDIKNSKVLVRDKASSVIVFNGKDYYATTISDLEKPLLDKIEEQDNKIEEQNKQISLLESDFSKHKTAITEELSSMATIIKTLIGGK